MNDFQGFESYLFGAWASKGIVEKAPTHLAKPKVPELWKSTWKVAVSVAVFSFITVSALVLNDTGAAYGLQIDSHDAKTEVISPLAATKPDPGFASLFSSFKSGTPLIPSDSIRLLAERAVQNRNEIVNVDSWARRLADDVKDATD